MLGAHASCLASVAGNHRTSVRECARMFGGRKAERKRVVSGGPTCACRSLYRALAHNLSLLVHRTVRQLGDRRVRLHLWSLFDVLHAFGANLPFKSGALEAVAREASA